MNTRLPIDLYAALADALANPRGPAVFARCGHPASLANTYHYDGKTSCRLCRKAASAWYRAQRTMQGERLARRIIEDRGSP